MLMRSGGQDDSAAVGRAQKAHLRDILVKITHEGSDVAMTRVFHVRGQCLTWATCSCPVKLRVVRLAMPPHDDDPGSAPAHFAGLSVLIVEDETLVAMLLEDMLADLGCEIAGSASTVAAALDMLDTAAADVALDLNLGGESCYPVAEALAARGAAIIFATGYGDARVEEPWRDGPILQKPFGEDQFARALAAAIAERPAKL
jgi:CheY-like chemotaxis protein